MSPDVSAAIGSRRGWTGAPESVETFDMIRFATLLALLSTLALGAGCGAPLRSNPPAAVVSGGTSVDRYDHSAPVERSTRTDRSAGPAIPGTRRAANCGHRCD